MKRKKFHVFMLVISILVSSSIVNSLASNTTLTVEESLEVNKEVYNGLFWVDEIDADINDIITFRITVTYHNVTNPDNAHYAENIIVKDTLPYCLEYNTGSASPFEPTLGMNENTFFWNIPGVLYDGESIEIIFNATVIDYGENINVANATASEHCTGLMIQGEDTATVSVSYPNPEIQFEKYVWNGDCNWVNQVGAYPQETVTFKIVIENTGSCNITDVWINDTLPIGLSYIADSSLPFEPIIQNQHLSWFFDVFEKNEVIEIIFNASVTGLPCSTHINWAYFESNGPCGFQLFDQDSARVFVYGMCIDKEVWDEDLGSWTELIVASVGDIVRFRICINYHGPKTLYNIFIRDELPLCFSYANNAIPEDPVVNGNILTWDLPSSYDLHNNEELIIEFDAEVNSGLCDDCVNEALVTADECSGKTFTAEDSATVFVVCEFTCDAGGPYSGNVGEQIMITGSAFDGKLPYLFEWDLEDDGEDIYDDATGEQITYTWDEGGSYIIKLRVTDDDGELAYDYASVEIIPEENNPPNKPLRPSGSISGRKGVSYTYSSSSSDPDGDQIYYWFDWGDGSNSGWIGPYNSGQTVSESHIWNFYGSYSVKVKAKDADEATSTWSSSLSVSMPKNKAIHSSLLLFLENLVDNYPQLFPFLNNLLTMFSL